MNKTISINVQGKVQGVWYRKFILDRAVELNITGFVKNLPDDSVYMVATGTDEQLKQFINNCWQGSPRSKVTHVEVKEMPLQLFQSFNIER
jgi:acylphosphatase